MNTQGLGTRHTRQVAALMADKGTGDWQQEWFLDGKMGRVETGAEGMELHAGPKVGDSAHHMVLWTRRRFTGDLRIDFDYTRLDSETRNVNIIYLFASGSGHPPYDRDLRTWCELRSEPRMPLYFDHVNTYHISFAAFEMVNEDPAADYVRARRYRPDLQRGLEGTDLPSDYADTGLFLPNKTYHITVTRVGERLLMRVSADGQTHDFQWSTAGQPPLTEGHIGFRLMYGRASRFANIEVHQLDLADLPVELRNRD